MTTTFEQIDIWRATASEHERLEFKEAKKQFDTKKLFKYCVAIANEGGGHLLLGIADTPPRLVIGTSAFGNLTGMTRKIFEAVGFRVNIEEVKHPDGRVLVFHVPSRPRGTAYHFKGAYLMRSGDSLVPMSEDKLRTIFAEGGSDWLEQPAVENKEASEVIRLLDTQTFFDLLGLSYPNNRENVLEELVRERLIEKTGRGYTILRLSAILLGKNLTDFPSNLARKAPRVVVYSGTSKTEAKQDQLGTKGYAAGFQGLVEFVMGHLPQNEAVENTLRREIKLVPEITIRELIANALVHQDFTVAGMSVMIEIYSDRVEISNPGEPIVPVERFIDGYQSRNERLTDFMRRFSICEERSSGIDQVIKAVEEYQLPAPDFRSNLQRTEVVLFGHTPFNKMNLDARVRACYQHCALQWVSKEPITNRSLRERFRLPESKSEAISRTIRDTIEAGKIKPFEPEKKSLRYRSYVPFWA